MTNTVDYLPIANGGGANVESQAQYVTDLGSGGSLQNGYVAGVAQSAQVNKTLRQSSIMTAAIANVISNRSSINVLDDGNLSALIGLLSGTFDATYTNIAALRTLTTFIDTYVAVQGSSTLLDGGGGIYVWNSTDTRSDNGTTVVKPTSISGAGRWNLFISTSNTPAPITLLSSVSGTNTILASAPAFLTGYAVGDQFLFIAANDITSAATININSIGAVNITKAGTIPLYPKEIRAGGVYLIIYDGTEFQLINPSQRSGQVLQVVMATDAGSSTTSTVFVNMNSSTVSITPVSVNSKLIVDVQFGASEGIVTNVNTFADFQLFETTGAGLIGAIYGVDAITNAIGAGASTAANIRLSGLSNAALTTRSFELFGKTNNSGAAASAQNMNWVITEISN